MTPLPLYIHIPFCRRKCAYCDFCSFVPASGDMKKYFSLLKSELLLKLRELDPASISISSIYFGGGTPSLADPGCFGDLLEFICKNFRLSPDAEISMEANPESVHLKKLKGFRSAGINRISLGIQSLDNKVLAYLGRLADRDANLKAAEAACAAGFRNINYDLMFGLPLQDARQVEKDILDLLPYGPTHFSLYSLILHRGTALEKRIRREKPPMADERETYDAAAEWLERQGFKTYELSNFAKPGFECRHNVAYWNYDAYAAIGISSVGREGNIRYTNHATLKKYAAALSAGKVPVKHKETLSGQTMKNEYVMMNFRKTEGITRKDYSERFGQDFVEEFGKTMENMKAKGLIGWDKKKVYIRKKGRFISNSIIVEFFG